MSSFALNLDLSLYFEDQRRYSCVFVDSTKCKEVGDVENHIKSIFKLEDSICLSNRKFLIPSCEDIRILQQYETVIVQKCDFYSQQIHQIKSTDEVSDHIALNLVQTEKSIDLSCRPKQRLKINICRTSEAEVPSFIKTYELYVPRLNTVSNQSDETPIKQGEKQKNLKKKLHSKRNEKESYNETNEYILDMSLQSEVKCLGNRVQENEEPENDMSFSSNCSNKNKTHLESDLSLISLNDSLKKTKKRKHLSEHAENLSNTNTSFDDSAFVNDNSINCVKKKKKSSKKNKTDGDFIDTDSFVSLQKNEDEEISHSTDYADVLEKNKQKKSNKSDKLKEYYEENNESYVYRSTCTDDDIDQFTGNTSKTKYHKEKKSQNSTNDIENDEEHAASECNKESTLNNFYLKNGEVENLNNSQELVIYGCKNTNNYDTSSNSINESNSFTQGTEEPKQKRKRVRKHNKKKKKENIDRYAVAPLLNTLSMQPVVQQPQASSTKHIFFTDENTLESEINQTSPNNTCSQEEMVVSIDTFEKDKQNHSEESSQRLPTEKPTSWQEGLLKLASNSSKPIVFRRSFHSTSSDKTEQNQTIDSLPPSQGNLSSVRDQETKQLKDPVTTLNNTKSYNNDSKQNQVGNISLEETARKCNGDVASDAENIPCSSADTSVLVNQQKLDESNVSKLINVKNIVVKNYPIISKIKHQDLILFKMLTLKESKEPGISETILARVINCSSFPDKISLEIFDGSISECGESHDNGLLELCWADMIEPRLFYP